MGTGLLERHAGKGEKLGMAVLPKWEAENVGQGFVGKYLGSKEVAINGKEPFMTQIFTVIESDYVFSDGANLNPGDIIEVGGVRLARALRTDHIGRNVLVVYKGKDTEQATGTPANLFHIELMPK